MYLTFTEYQDMGGKLEQTAFTSLELKSRKLIDKYTMNRLINLETQSEAVKGLMFELINSGSLDSDLKSESVDGWNRVYLDKTEQKTALNDLIEQYLVNETLEDGTPYLYRGV